MFRSTRTLRRFTVGALSAAALAGALGVGGVVAQQQTAATKVTALMKQAISEYPGHEVTMLTLDIPPGADQEAVGGWRPLYENCRERANELHRDLQQCLATELSHLETAWPRELN